MPFMWNWHGFIHKNKSEVIPAITQCEESLFKGYSYQALDSSFREEVDAVAISSFPQQQAEETPLDTNRQISYDSSQSISAIPDIKQENKQYRAWIKNIKIVLQKMQKPELRKISDYKNEWESSIESILKDLSIENSHLTEECKKKNQEIQFLEGLLRKIEEENIEMIDAVASYQPLEVSEESIKRYSFSSSTETIVPEEASIKYVRGISEESGYSSQESIYNSTETIVPEEPESVFKQTNTQITELEKKNELHKEWIKSLDKNLNSNLTLNFIKRSMAPNLKTFEDLKFPSFKNAELKQENKKKKEILQSLGTQIIENVEINTVYQELLSEEIYLYKLNKLEKKLYKEQKELEDIDSYFKKLHEKAAKLHAGIETFTKCLV